MKDIKEYNIENYEAKNIFHDAFMNTFLHYYKYKIKIHFAGEAYKPKPRAKFLRQDLQKKLRPI